MRLSDGKRFRKRMLTWLLCAVVTMQSFLPVVSSTVFAAEVPDAPAGTEEQTLTGAENAEQPAAVVTAEPVAEPAAENKAEEASESSETSETAQESAGEEAASDDPAENFSAEEIAEAEAFYDIKTDPEEEPSEAEILAEEQEKARNREEAEKDHVDDSAKLLIGPEDEGSEGEEAAGASERFVKATFMNVTLPLRFSEFISRAAASNDYPIHLIEDIRINKTAYIPDGKTVTIYLRGHDIIGDEIGSNPLFRVGKNATLRIIGLPNREHRNRLIGGGDGAIVAKDNSTVILQDLWVERNTAGGNGGGIYLDARVKCELTNVGIYGNIAGSGGGGIYVNGQNSNLHIDSRSEITNNEAKSGGGIYVDGSKVNIYGPAVGKVQIANNTAKTGGGIYFNSTDIAANNLEIKNNKATNGHGGGVRMEKTKTSIANCEICDNTATENGGGVYINGKVGTLTDAVIKGNRCGEKYYGGGIYVDSMDNVSTGGKFVVTENYEGDGFDRADDLYLQNGVKTDAFMHAASYAPGSKIGIGVSDWKEGQRITFAPGNFNAKLFYCNNQLAHRKHKNNTDYYVALNSNNHLVITSNASQALFAVDKPISNRETSKTKTEKSGFEYVTKDGKGYDVSYGFVSSPSHTDETKDIVNKYFYSDGYFFDDPTVYNTHLSTFGMNLAMASADSNIGSHSDYSFKFDNVKSMLLGIGCEDSDIYISPSYIVKPTDSSIGFAIGKKTIKNKTDGKEYTLVPIAIRSYGYEKEWASNMTLNAGNTEGKNDEASGFKDARTKVMNGIRSYISAYGLDGQLSQGRVKFFLVGFSRGSATANLTSKALVDEYGLLSDKYKNNPNQVFGYCYAVPAGGTDTCDTSLQKNKKAYYCIHNIINKVDLTPMVAPKEMGFKRYGVDHFVPGNDAGTVKSAVEYGTKDNGSPKLTTFYDNTAWLTNSENYRTKRPAMLQQLKNVNDEVYFVDNFKETDLILGKSQGIKSFIKGRFTETSMIKREPVKGSSLIIENWLPDFYKKVQNYYTLDEEKTLTRWDYSNFVVRAGKQDSSKLKGRRFWYEKGTTAQDTFRGLVMMLLSKTPTEKANLGAAFAGMGNKLGFTEIVGLYEKLINSKTGWDYDDDRQQKYLDMFWNKLKDNSYGQKALQDALSAEEMNSLENYYPALMSIIFRVVRQDFNEKSHSGKLRLAGTFASNTEAILQGHVPEIYLAWLRAYDDYYNLSAENNAYLWKQETRTGSKNVTITVSGEVVPKDGSKTCENDQIVKLASEGTSDAIYYKLWKDDSSEKEAIMQLYNDRQGIPLRSGSGDINYKLKAWTKNSYAAQDDRIEWKQGNETNCTITVRPQQKKPLKIKWVLYSFDEHDGRSGVVKESTVDSITFMPGQELRFKISDVMKEYTEAYQLDKYYFSFWEGKGCFGTTDMVTVKGKTVDDYEIKVSMWPRVDTWKIDGDGLNAMKPVAGNPLKTDIDTTVRYANTPDHFNSGPRKASVKWQEKKGSDFVNIKDTKVGNNKTYRVELSNKDPNITPIKRGFTEIVKVMVGNDVVGEVRPYDAANGRTVTFTREFAPTEKLKINSCAVSGNEIWIWKRDVNTEAGRTMMRKAVAASLPGYSASIAAADRTVSGLQVDWDTDSIPDADLEKTEFTVRGTIRHSEGTAGYSFREEEYDWSDIGDAFVVSATVHVVNTSKLNPPAPDLQGGSYDVARDVMPVNENGDLIITLNDTNEGIENTEIRYKRYKEGDAPGEYVHYDGPIRLEKPVEGETISWNILVSSNMTVSESGFESSDEKLYTYTLTNPELHSIYGYARDVNSSRPAGVKELKNSSSLILRSLTGEEAMVDYYDLLPDADDRDCYSLVSWNRLTVSGDTVTEEHMDVFEDGFWAKVSDNDVIYEALYAPMIDYVDVVLEKPETGEGLTDVPDYLTVQIGGDLYSIDPSSVSVNWTASENSTDDGIVRSKTTYTAKISISADSLRYFDGESDSSQKLGLKFFEDEADNMSIYVDDVDMNNIVSGNEAGVEDISYDAEYDDIGLVTCFNVYVTYEKTGMPTFYMVIPPDGLSVSFNEATINSRFDSDVWPNLPKEAAVIVDDGSVQTLSVNWIDEPLFTDYGFQISKADLNNKDDWSLSMNGYVTLPDGMKYDTENRDIVSEGGEVHCYFGYPVYMEGAPESDMPEILPQSGVYEPSTDNLIVNFNYKGSPLTASSNNVEIYYKLTYGYYEDEEGDVGLDDAPCWYDGDGNLQYDHIYIPHWGEEYIPHADDPEEGASDAAKDLAYRTVTRKKVQEGPDGPYDFVKVTAVALEKGAFRISNIADEYYEFTEKPVSDIPDEKLDQLNAMELTSGKALQTLVLPEGCVWSAQTDIWTPQDGYAGDYVNAQVVYNEDPERFEDLVINVKILLTAGTYNILADECEVRLVDEEEGPDPEDWEVITSARAESMVYVSANEPKDERVLIDWVITDSTGEEVDWTLADENDSENIGEIVFTMPYSAVRIKPVWAKTESEATVTSLTVDKTALELKKGGSGTITAAATYSGEGERPEITFMSSDPQIASVTYSDGVAKVTAVSSGSATIWVECAEKVVTCQVSVGLVYVDLNLTDCKAYDVTGEAKQPLTDTGVKGSLIRLVADPSKNPSVSFNEWTIEGANIDKSKSDVTFVLNTDLVAKAEYGTNPDYEDPGDYEYKNVRIKSLTLTDPTTKKKASKLSLSLNSSGSVIAKAVYNNRETSKPPIIFRSSNTDVAKVRTVSVNEGEAEGIIVGCRPGTSVITAYCGNRTAKLTVTVEDQDLTGIIVESARLARNSEVVDGQYVLELFGGEQELLSAYPDDLFNTTPMKITWKSDDKKVATVNNGLVTARTFEKAHTTITVTAKTKPFGSKKWVSLKPVKIVVRIKETELPKNERNDKSYKLSLKKSQTLDLTADAVKKKNVVSGCEIIAKTGKGSGPSSTEWRSTNESIVTVSASKTDPLKAYIKATGTGTAYVVVDGTVSGSNLKNRAVMKVTVKATAPRIYFTNDSLDAFSEDMKTLTLKQGSSDRLVYNIEVDGAEYPFNTTEKVVWSSRGGVTVTDGVVYAKTAPKSGKPAKVTLKCGRTKVVLDVYVK